MEKVMLLNSKIGIIIDSLFYVCLKDKYNLGCFMIGTKNK